MPIILIKYLLHDLLLLKGVYIKSEECKNHNRESAVRMLLWFPHRLMACQIKANGEETNGNVMVTM